ncbi:uncharacterized protein APUU_70011A [Aspergillus puulaauensis]|uniref:Uncharacterized protein n=1 Tax=Aspergillus puulaauensis TaxID=1220207 RepID=A0A7R7XVD4_9EURO|nr:uncharacterized protein APUU_70011A [Aspergillus puulaauensis]BCS28441.1 hypothetical protein APUU_70011A [Aspergillus puulaauensis]
MHLIKSTTLLALAALATRSSAATCENTWTSPNLYYDWKITAPDVPEIPAVCGRLWDELRCPAPSRTSYRDDSGTLVWKFTTGIGCNAGDVESAWFRATKDSYGTIAC